MDRGRCSGNFEARRAKILVAEGCERLAEHAAFSGRWSLIAGRLAPRDETFRGKDSLPFGLNFQRLGMAEVPLKLRLPESLVRGLVALLAMPFLLLVALAVALWVIAPHKRRVETARRRSRWWVAVDIAAAVLGVGMLDLLDAF